MRRRHSRRKGCTPTHGLRLTLRIGRNAARRRTETREELRASQSPEAHAVRGHDRCWASGDDDLSSAREPPLFPSCSGVSARRRRIVHRPAPSRSGVRRELLDRRRRRADTRGFERGAALRAERGPCRAPHPWRRNPPHRSGRREAARNGAPLPGRPRQSTSAGQSWRSRGVRDDAGDRRHVSSLRHACGDHGPERSRRGADTRKRQGPGRSALKVAVHVQRASARVAFCDSRAKGPTYQAAGSEPWADRARHETARPPNVTALKPPRDAGFACGPQAFSGI
jgi:hypothetical protein